MEENENRQDGSVYSDGAASVDGQLENLQQQGNGQQQQTSLVLVLHTCYSPPCFHHVYRNYSELYE